MKKCICGAGLLMMSVPALAEGLEARSPFALPGGWWLALIVFALIAALVVVGILRAELKTAVQKDSASQYIQEGSLKLRVNSDRFLYRTETRRKIEQKKED